VATVKLQFAGQIINPTLTQETRNIALPIKHHISGQQQGISFGSLLQDTLLELQTIQQVQFYAQELLSHTFSGRGPHLDSYHICKPVSPKADNREMLGGGVSSGVCMRIK
jgi:hypothetical protein